MFGPVVNESTKRRFRNFAVLSLVGLTVVAPVARDAIAQNSNVPTSPPRTGPIPMSSPPSTSTRPAQLPAGAVDGGLAAFADRLDRMERDIRALNLRVSRGGGISQASANRPGTTREVLEGPAAARMAVRLNALEADLRQATGRLEEVSFGVRQLTDRFEKLVADLDYRLSRLNGGAPPSAARPDSPTPNGGASAVAPSGVSTAPRTGVLGTIPQAAADLASQVGANTPAPTPSRRQVAKRREAAPTPVAPQAVAAVSQSAGPLPPGSPRDRYAYAFRLLRQRNYDQAEIALNAFLEAHPQDPLAANAKYWLGETHYVRKQYVKAAEIFLDGYKTYPNGPKTPDTLLKLGMTLTALDKKEQACATFAKLKRDHPDASASILETMRRERTRAGCPR